jgi:mono/diheme cytochrome c family protein
MRMKALGVVLMVGFAAFTTFYWITDAPRREVFEGIRDEELLEFGQIVFLADDTFTVDIKLTPEGFAQEVEGEDGEPVEEPIEALELFVNASISFANDSGEDVTVTGTGTTPFEHEIAAGASAPQKFGDEGETTVTVSGIGGQLLVTAGPPHLQPYGANCARCHGVDGHGFVTDPTLIGPDLHSTDLANKWAQTGGAQGLNNYVQWVITLGGVVRSGNINSAMPAWGQEYGGPLTRQQIEAVTAMIGEWLRETLENPPPSPVEVPDTVEAGAEVYAQAGCVGCHGADLEGGVGPNLQTVGTALTDDLPTPVSQNDQRLADYDDDPRAFFELWIRDSAGNYNDGDPTGMPAHDVTVLTDSELQALITFLLDQTE